MYREKKVALVIPAYREEKLIADTLRAVPPLVDQIFVVDDCSPDNQNAVVIECSKKDPRVTLLKHTTNQGPGAGIITGYREAVRLGHDLIAVVGGDNQMNLSELPRFLDPIVDGVADYSKGNRFDLREFDATVLKMPKVRFFANWIITAMAKVATGYFKSMDFVDGYTVISRKAAAAIDWSKAWKGYGYPMDFLVRLNAYGFRIVDVPRAAIYLPGVRQSQIKGPRYAIKVTPMLVRNFFWRLHFKYLYRDFHPLVFFYYMSFLLIPFGTALGGYLLWDKFFALGTMVTGPKAILVALSLLGGSQFLLFAIHFDMTEGRSFEVR